MSDSRWRADRGATMVEYALLVAIVAVGLIGSLRYVEAGASSRVATRGNAIGHPEESGTTTTTSTKPGPGASTSTTTTTSPFSVITEGSCTGTPSTNSCTFTLSPPPDPSSTVAWQISPTTGVTGSLPGPVTLTVTGQFTIQATVNDVGTSPLIIRCTSNGASGNVDCIPQ